MSTVYATVSDVEKKLKGLYPDGFDNTTDPTEAEVAEDIEEVTTQLRVRVVRALGQEPTADSDGATLIKRGVVAKVVAEILREKSVGYGAADIAALTKPYEDIYTQVIAEIKMLPDMFRETATEELHVGHTRATAQRLPLLSDDAIGDFSRF